jgi:hypothetical protein
MAPSGDAATAKKLHPVYDVSAQLARRIATMLVDIVFAKAR